LLPKTTLTTLVRISVVAAVAKAAADVVEAEEEAIAVAAPIKLTNKRHKFRHIEVDGICNKLL
jgi:hypothetical protein